MGWTEDEIARRMSDLPERFADRISPDSLRSIRRNRDAGEPLSTVLALIRSLHRHRAEISGRERAELQDYLTRRDTPDESDQIPGLLSVAGALLAEIPLTEGLPEERIEATARSLRPMFEHLIPEQDRWELAEAEDPRTGPTSSSRRSNCSSATASR